MASPQYQHPYRSIQNHSDDHVILLSPSSAYSPYSPQSVESARKPSLETAYFHPEKQLEPHITERWEQSGRKINPTPTQRYETIARQGVDDMYLRMRKAYRTFLLATLALVVLQAVLAGAGIAVTDGGALQGSLIWTAIWAVLTLLMLGIMLFAARIQKELTRRALIGHVATHTVSCLIWMATAIAVVDLVAHAKKDTYAKVRRGFAETPGKVADVSELIGLVPAARGFGFVVALVYGLVVWRAAKLLRHAMI